LLLIPAFRHYLRHFIISSLMVFFSFSRCRQLFFADVPLYYYFRFHYLRFLHFQLFSPLAFRHYFIIAAIFAFA
jgi:hypothetical protein